MANINKDIARSKIEIESVMQKNLALIAESIIRQVMAKAKRLKPSNILKAIKNIKPTGANKYKSDLKAVLAVLSSDALDQARKEIPNAKKVKLMENEHRLLFGEFEKLPPDIRKRIETANQLLIGTQIADLEKALFFHFTSAVGSEKNLKEIESELNDKAESYILGQAIQAGSSVVAANVVNEARNAFFFKDDVLKEIEAFQFMNGDPVSQVCTDMAGTIFKKDDPNAIRFTPPLHFNCKSWIRPIISQKELNRSIAANKNNPKRADGIEKLKPSTKKIEDTIQFSDISEASEHDCQLKCNINL